MILPVTGQSPNFLPMLLTIGPWEHHTTKSTIGIDNEMITLMILPGCSTSGTASDHSPIAESLHLFQLLLS
ncbi:MAG: hypothetical protein ACK4UN_08060 [Limisphaerales bacterium]